MPRGTWLLALPLLAAALAVWLRRGERKRTAWANETAEECACFIKSPPIPVYVHAPSCPGRGRS